mmetsp:Transcript_42793/g.136966  ORF Transcript_42793/g.136966 Transcript_42793/m.136966 type:complete len:222 (+) Transcript_42793:968-1633(+)
MAEGGASREPPTGESLTATRICAVAAPLASCACRTKKFAEPGGSAPATTASTASPPPARANWCNSVHHVRESLRGPGDVSRKPQILNLGRPYSLPAGYVYDAVATLGSVRSIAPSPTALQRRVIAPYSARDLTDARRTRRSLAFTLACLTGWMTIAGGAPCSTTRDVVVVLCHPSFSTVSLKLYFPARRRRRTVDADALNSGGYPSGASHGSMSLVSHCHM